MVDGMCVLRFVEPGDICLLLVPEPEASAEDAAQLARLQAHQAALQARYGGRLANPIHLTCQRFTLNGQYPARLPDLLARLQAIAAELPPLPLIAADFQVLSRPGRTEILKWRVEVDEPLAALSALLFEQLAPLGVEFLYSPGWVSTLVTALYDVHAGQLSGSDPVVPAERSIAAPMPLPVDGRPPLGVPPPPLFTGRKLIVSRFVTLQDIETLAEFPLHGRSAFPQPDNASFRKGS